MSIIRLSARDDGSLGRNGRPCPSRLILGERGSHALHALAQSPLVSQEPLQDADPEPDGQDGDRNEEQERNHVEHGIPPGKSTPTPPTLIAAGRARTPGAPTPSLRT